MAQVTAKSNLKDGIPRLKAAIDKYQPKSGGFYFELVKVLPPHLRENFEKAERQIQADYAMSPGVTGLVRLWLACDTSAQIRREFELAVLDR